MIELIVWTFFGCACPEPPAYQLIEVPGHCMVTMDPPFLKKIEVPCVRYYRFTTATGEILEVGCSWKKGEGIEECE